MIMRILIFITCVCTRVGHACAAGMCGAELFQRGGARMKICRAGRGHISKVSANA